MSIWGGLELFLGG